MCEAGYGRIVLTSSIGGLYGNHEVANYAVAKAVVSETPGVYRPAWSIADVGEHIAAIGDATAPVVFPVVPDGHGDHIRYSFAMAKQGAVHA